MATTYLVPAQPHANSAFPYVALESTLPQFRLLRVLGIRDERLDFELQTFDLPTEGLVWKALSYRWTKDEASKLIWLNDRDFYVRPNLHDFLKQMLRDGGVYWIFVDAICINQNDIAERSGQVRLMRDIYRDAQEVVIWISNGNNFEHVFPKSVAWAGEYKESQDTKTRALACEIMKSTLAIIAQDEFWIRLWIVQEVLLARRLIIWLGTFKIEAESFNTQLFGHIERTSRKPGSYVKLPNDRLNAGRLEIKARQVQHAVAAQDVLQVRELAKTDLRAGKRMDFSDAMILFSTRRCSLIQDKVLGLLGVADMRIIADYDTPLVEFFIDVLADCLISRVVTKPLTEVHTSDLPTNNLIADVDNLGTATFQAFDVSPTHPLIFLLSFEVMNALNIDTGGGNGHLVLVMQSLNPESKIITKSGRLKGDRKWYETRAASRKRLWRELVSRFYQARSILDENKRHNKVLSSPWRISDEKDDARNYDEWTQLVRSRCEALLQRWTERQSALID